MKLTRSTIHRFLAVTALAASSAALASGGHSGGHGHSHSHGHGDGGESAIGKPGVSAKANRSITIEMSDDMRFTPSNIRVKRGETVRLVVKNVGQVKHELSLGTEKELLAHLEEMKKAPEMEHEEPGKVTLEPGRQGEIVWQFTKAGVVNFACLIPGHYEAGMRGTVQVGGR